MALRYPEILSLASPPVEIAYSRRDAMLYALSVGAGGEGLEGGELPLVYEKDMRVLPTLATNLLLQDNSLIDDAGIDFRMVLHSEQRLRVLRPLPPEGRMVVRTRIAHVADKGADKGAVVDIEHAIADAASGDAHALVTLTLFCRGDGGFGGPSQSAQPAHEVPDRPADRTLDLRTASNQAALYRLVLGEDNPLHIDPDFARQVGFDRPILHGLCTYGFACRAVVQAWCNGDPARVHSFDVRFAAPFHPGETLTTRMWCDGSLISFECLSAERGVTVLRNGRCEISETEEAG